MFGGQNYLLEPLRETAVLALDTVFDVIGASNVTSNPVEGHTVSGEDTMDGHDPPAWRPVPEPGETYEFDESEGGHITAPDPRYHHAAAAWGDDKLVIVGGEGDMTDIDSMFNDCWVLDIKTGQWRQLPDCPRTCLRSAAAVLGGRTLAVIGGISSQPGGTLPGSCWMLDLVTASAFGAVGLLPVRPAEDFWTLVADPLDEIPSPFDPRQSHGRFAMSKVAVPLHGGRAVVVLGGHTEKSLNHFGDPTGGYLGPHFGCTIRVAAEEPEIPGHTALPSGAARVRPLAEDTWKVDHLSRLYSRCVTEASVDEAAGCSVLPAASVQLAKLLASVPIENYTATPCAQRGSVLICGGAQQQGTGASGESKLRIVELSFS